LLVGALVPLGFAPGIGHVSAAVLTLLVGLSIASVALALGSGRATFLATTAVVLLLDVGRLPVRPGPGYEEPEALWRTDQTLAVTALSSPGGLGSLALLAQPVVADAESPLGVGATVNGEAAAWQCPFQPGVQWLQLPIDPALPASGTSLDVRLRLTGAPDRDHDYLVVFRSSRREGFLVQAGAPDPSIPAPVTSCVRVG
jgi:hypothetical protein